jgi:uncharacterized membrane protein YfcA
MSELLLLCAGAFFAGLVDAVVGGGGLIQVPLLFSALPAASPATLFGTNKLSSVLGTGFAAWRFGRSIRVPWHMALPAAAAAFAASYAGALTVALLPKDLLRPLVLVLLLAVAVYTFVRKDFGSDDGGRIHGRRDMTLAVVLGAVIGFYDGFFGPGAGSFLLFLFVRFFAWDFVRASAAAKIVNAATNLAALLYFVPSGNVIFRLGFAMAAFNIAGSLVGSHLALKHGSTFVRKLFLIVVSVLIAKFAYDTFR